MAVVGAVAVARREAVIFARLWRGIAFSGFVAPVLYLGAMGIGLGGLVDESSGSVGGLDYLSFVAPGLLAASLAQLAAADSLWPVMAGTKWWRTYHAMVATPLRAADVARGVLLWQAVRAAMSGTIFLFVAAALGGVPSAWGVLALPAAVLGAAAHAAPIAAFAATRDSDAPFALLMRLVILPLFLFSGAFFPIDQLPDALEPVARLSPLYHAVELCRAATTGTWDASVPVHVLVLVAVLLAGMAAGARTFTTRLAA